MSRQQQPQQQPQFFQPPHTQQQRRLFNQYQYVPKNPQQDQYIQINSQVMNDPQMIRLIKQFNDAQERRFKQQWVEIQPQRKQPQIPTPRPSGLAGMFARAKQAATSAAASAKRAAGFKTQQQKQQQLNAEKGRQVMELIERVDKSITDKVLAKVANVVPTVLSKDRKLKLKVKVATVLSNLGIIKLSDEEKLLIAAAPIYMKAKKFMDDTISYISAAAVLAGRKLFRGKLFRGGSTKKTIKSKPKTMPKSKPKSKPKPRKIKINH